jgi:hypothetical protein
MNNSVQQRVRRVLGVSVYILVAASSLFHVFHPERDRLDLVLGLAFSVTMTYWCIVDSRIAERPVLRSFYWLIFFLWPIAVPIYLVWSRKLRGLGFVLLHFTGLCVVNIVVYNLAGYLAFGNAWFHPSSRLTV